MLYIKEVIVDTRFRYMGQKKYRVDLKRKSGKKWNLINKVKKEEI